MTLHLFDECISWLIFFIEQAFCKICIRSCTNYPWINLVSVELKKTSVSVLNKAVFCFIFNINLLDRCVWMWIFSQEFIISFLTPSSFVNYLRNFFPPQDLFACTCFLTPSCLLICSLFISMRVVSLLFSYTRFYWFHRVIGLLRSRRNCLRA